MRKLLLAIALFPLCAVAEDVGQMYERNRINREIAETLKSEQAYNYAAAQELQARQIERMNERANQRQPSIFEPPPQPLYTKPRTFEQLSNYGKLDQGR